MNILILSTKVPFPPKDGGAIATLTLAEGLADTGNKVKMLCFNTSKHPFDVQRIPGVLKKKIDFFSVDHDTGIRPFKAVLNLLFSRKPYNATRFISRKYARALRSLLHKEPYDIVQLEGPYTGYYLHLIRAHSDARIALRAHNVEYEIWQRKAVNSRHQVNKIYFRLLAKRIKSLEKTVMQQVDYLIAISERDRQQLQNLHKIPGITIPTGLNSYRYPAPKEPSFPTLFYIGALDWMPNQEGILWFVEKVFPCVREQLQSVQLHIAGRNAPSWLISKLSDRQNKGIFFHGEVENAYEYMNHYAIFVSPLFTGSGIRIKILEGMMMRRVVVATPVAAEGIPVSDRKNIIIAHDALEMKEQIINICRNKDLYDQIAHQSMVFVKENFNNLATCKRLSDFYRTARA